MNGINFLKFGLRDYGGLCSKSAQILIFSNFSGKYQYSLSFLFKSLNLILTGSDPP